MANLTYHVAADRYDDPQPRFDEESGETYYIAVPGYRVVFTTSHGHAYRHFHLFPDTPEGAARARRLADKVTALLNDKGVDGLDHQHWGMRTIYGSAAYVAEEPMIVNREKFDALLQEGYSVANVPL